MRKDEAKSEAMAEIKGRGKKTQYIDTLAKRA